ncbi:ribosomal protein L7/L12 [Glycomyces sp. MUSA5-2]|uniref:ribosomal protein L7/L12 n=1 Tax=Glycomyces sp. MUSA5-2 TaxID=2053002 RepID=UPI00300ADAF9
MAQPRDYITMQALSRIEYKLDMIMAHLGIPQSAPPEEPWLAQVRSEIRSGRTIQAIKVYREHTGLGLKEAKDAVERMAKGY